MNTQINGAGALQKVRIGIAGRAWFAHCCIFGTLGREALAPSRF